MDTMRLSKTTTYGLNHGNYEPKGFRHPLRSNSNLGDR